MDLMALIAQKKAALNSSKRQKTIKPADGRSRYRVLPTWSDDKEAPFWHDFGQHFIKDGAGDIKAVYVCTDKTFGKPCPVCEGITHAIKSSGDDVMTNLLKEAYATGRILLNVLHIDGATPTEPQILETAPTVFNDILGIISEWGVGVLDLQTGMDLIIERSGKGKQTKYSVQIASKSQPVPEGVMKKVANLDEYVAQENEEGQKRALANLSAVAGLLPAPTAPRKPALADISLDDDQEAGLAAVDAASSKPATAAKAAPAAADTTGDAELDNLLAELG